MRRLVGFDEFRLGELSQKDVQESLDRLGDLGELASIKPDLAERYAQGDIAAHLHFPGRFLSVPEPDSEPWCALLHAGALLRHPERLDGRRIGALVALDQSVQNLPRVAV